MSRFLPFLLLLLSVAVPANARSCGGPVAVCPQAANGGLPLIAGGHPAPIIADGKLGSGVMHALFDLQGDFASVAGNRGELVTNRAAASAAIIVGTIGKSPIIDRLVREKKLDATGLAGQWEAYAQQVVANPAPGIGKALIIAGADKRGTIFGIYDLSRRIGVSPWVWWADVPPKQSANLFVLPGRRLEKPTVHYRGIFINDEDPALGGWVKQTFGEFNHRFYEHVFDLILRMRGNFLWPAMWGKSFYEEDPENAQLANEMGVIIGTSHHEPMMRAQVDWDRHGKGPWDYSVNAEQLRQFWREGIERTQGDERVVTVGMRGNGDKPMTQGTAISLLERIVGDQRKIIADVTGKPAAGTPQVWALYKEVQDYYDKGMRVPDDVTLLFSDDNWGNIRRLPHPDAKRAGGYGIYYHFDYVGGPRNYKWINTNQIVRTWEQMHLARAYGADRLWIVNIGDIKPMEFPTEFFLDYAWDPDSCGLDCLADYPRKWAAEQFGDAHAAEIGELLTRYTQYNARRKPELLDPDTFSLDNFGEADRVVRDWNALAVKAEAVGKQLRPGQQSAYFELVLYPILASADLNELYVTVAHNRRLASEGDVRANGLADRAQALFDRFEALRGEYEAQAGGKWPHMMSQTVIGYTGWQQPDRDSMPEVRRVDPSTSKASAVPTDKYPIGPLEVPINAHGFVEENGIVAIEAPHYAQAVPGNGIKWEVIPNLGRSVGAVTAFPVTAAPQQAGKDPHLDYDVYLRAAGQLTLQITTAPTLDFRGKGQLRYAFSIDDQSPQIVNLATDDDRAWAQAVAQNAWIREVPMHVDHSGQHVIHLWLVDPGVDFERLVLFRGQLPKSYLGPPESERR
jgi:hypothetical protein